MSNLAKRIANLSPEKKALLLRQLISLKADTLVASNRTDQDIATGSVPLTPTQHWFFEELYLGPPYGYNWFNVSTLLQIHSVLNPAVLEQAVRYILLRHDALRSRYIRNEHGWRAFIAELDESTPSSTIDLSILREADQSAAVESAAFEAQVSLNLQNGPILRVIYFDFGIRRPGRLLVIVHHLVADAVSLSILVRDLLMAYEQLMRYGEVTLLPLKSSYKQWCEGLTRYARSAALRQELAYWLTLPWEQVVPLPSEFPAIRGISRLDSDEGFMLLNANETDTLLHNVLPYYNAQIMDVLLTALAQAYTEITKTPTLLVCIMQHGRESVLDHLDPADIIGYFTVPCPVLLDVRGATNAVDALRMVQGQLRRVPNNGFGFGILRYFSEDLRVTEQLEALPYPEIIVNYLGRRDQSRSSTIGPAPEPVGIGQNPNRRSRTRLVCTGFVRDGQLRLRWEMRGIAENAVFPTQEQFYRAKGLAQTFMTTLRTIIRTVS